MNKQIGLLLGGMLCALSANASVTSYSEGVELLADPTSYNAGNSPGTENNNIVVFEEQYSLKLGSDLVTDTGTISADTYIGSYLVNYNPVEGYKNEVNSSAWRGISFSDEILGVIFSWQRLDDTDTRLGHRDVTYETDNVYRGLELGSGDYYFVWDSNAAMSFKTTGYAIDQMRVITAAPVPLPAAVWMFGAGLISLVGFARRSANKAATAAV